MLLVAMCGRPQSGKSEIQKILEARFNIIARDDGACIREIAYLCFNIPYADTLSGAGKKKIVKINGQSWEVRKVLGEIGNALEDKFGDLVIPSIAIKRAQQASSYESGLDFAGFSFGSVRKNQALEYKKWPSVVIEVVRGEAEDTGNTFDLYDKSLVDMTFHNNSRSLKVLDKEFTEAFHDFTGLAFDSSIKWGEYADKLNSAQSGW